MNVKKYERNSLILFLLVIFFFLEIGFIIFLFLHKEYTYKKISSIVEKDNVLTLIVDKKERELFYKNKIIFIENKKRIFEITEDQGFLLKRNHKKYYEMKIKTKFSKKRVNDVLELSIKEKKKRLIEIIMMIWEGD